MSDISIQLPKLGESITTATVVRWFKKEGDFVKEDEPLLEVTTDKVNSEIPSTASGILKKIVVPVDKEIEVGAVLALISTDGSVATSAPVTNSSDNLSPAVLRLAGEKGISVEKLKTISGTGEGGRITKRDIENYENKPSNKPVCPMSGDVERMKMSGMRKAIADNLVRSFYEAPHASLVNEVDVTDVMAYIAREKVAFEKKHGYKLSITTFIAKAIAQAVQEFPLINASLEGDTIVVKRYVNLGIAVSVDQGLFVPVIRNCQTRSISDIAGGVSELAAKARSGKLSPDDTQEGTITMTNFGMGGTLIGIPIIRHPEVAIVGVGAITKKVAVLDDNTFGIRQTVYLSLTFDHRVLDGMYGCGFLSAVKKHLEHPDF